MNHVTIRTDRPISQAALDSAKRRAESIEFLMIRLHAHLTCIQDEDDEPHAPIEARATIAGQQMTVHLDAPPSAPPDTASPTDK